MIEYPEIEYTDESVSYVKVWNRLIPIPAPRQMFLGPGESYLQNPDCEDV